MSESKEITPPPFTKSGQIGSPQQAAFDKTQSAGQSQAALTKGGKRRRRRSNKYLKGGAGEVVTVPPLNGNVIPGVNGQAASTTSTSVNSQAQATGDASVGNQQPIVNSKGGRRRKKVTKRVKKSRKSRRGEKDRRKYT